MSILSTGTINVEEEIAKLTTELNYTKGFLKSVESKLANEKFVVPESIGKRKKNKLMRWRKSLRLSRVCRIEVI
jgi:valyl-tRNA synthetase